MPSLSPRLTLLLLLALALVILGGGWRLGRREESVRLDRDREALRRFAVDAQAELLQLEELYESHLSRLGRTVPNDDFEIRTQVTQVLGVRQFSLLHCRPAQSSKDRHVPLRPVIGERLPKPMFTAPPVGPISDVVLLEEAKLFDPAAPDSGWIDGPGRPLMFWQRRYPDEVAILLLDPKALDSALSQWLETWAAQSFEPVRSEGGPDLLRNRSGHALALSGIAPAERPDLLLPLRSRLGDWELASWDRREIRVSYDLPTLIATATVAVAVALLGFLVFGQQRRAAALAAQRVSFVNRVSHELRSPLTNIRLNVDLAADALDDIVPDATRRIALVQEEACRLGRLIDNVLTFSRHEQGKLQSQSQACIPDSVIGSVIDQFAPSYARRALVVTRTGAASAVCKIDADALAQILANLLSNVEKYVPGGPMEITSTLAADALTIVVRDEGPGIPAEAAERIFRPFERLGSRVNEGASGTGLGLAIARDLAASMGGTLRLVPAPRGAIFELCVPAPLAAPITAVASIS